MVVITTNNQKQKFPLANLAIEISGRVDLARGSLAVWYDFRIYVRFQDIISKRVILVADNWGYFESKSFLRYLGKLYHSGVIKNFKGKHYALVEAKNQRGTAIFMIALALSIGLLYLFSLKNLNDHLRVIIIYCSALPWIFWLIYLIYYYFFNHKPTVYEVFTESNPERLLP